MGVDLVGFQEVIQVSKEEGKLLFLERFMTGYSFTLNEEQSTRCDSRTFTPPIAYSSVATLLCPKILRQNGFEVFQFDCGGYEL